MMLRSACTTEGRRRGQIVPSACTNNEEHSRISVNTKGLPHTGGIEPSYVLGSRRELSDCWIGSNPANRAAFSVWVQLPC